MAASGMNGNESRKRNIRGVISHNGEAYVGNIELKQWPELST
jgi:hypothetical protein